MCLATVYKEEDNSVIFKNVSRIDVDGNKLILRDIMGDERVVEGSILIDRSIFPVHTVPAAEMSVPTGKYAR